MNYGRIAPWYRPLSRVVFGNTLIQAQRLALEALPADGRVLIAGGGDGELLKYLSHWTGAIDFVEISGEMIRLAQRQAVRPVRWFEQDIFDFRPDGTYNTILFPFLLDNFLPKEAEILIARLPSFLQQKGQVIIIDYTETPNVWQKILLRSMYLFFRAVADVRARALPPIKKIMQENGFCLSRAFSLYGGFIEVKYYHR
ncbi:MAG: class I SAM-dependent methyltransferase [Leadbetterella sp.]|nr:class I SAM-dependent methyltransferase [Leadbetterella sp.]